MQKRFLALFCLLLFLLQGCRVLNPAKEKPLTLSKEEKQLADSLAHFSQGMVYVNADGAYSPDALDSYQAALELEPEEAAAFIIPRILRYSLTHRPHIPSLEKVDKLCTQYFEGKMDKDPSNPLYYITLARIYFRQAEDDKAIAILKKGIKKTGEDNSIRMYCRLQGQEFFMAQEYLRTVACFELLSDKDAEQYERFHFILGELNEVLERPDEAEKNYLIAAEGDSPIPEAFIQLAMMYYEDSPKKAIKTMERAVEALPKNVKMNYFLGYFLSLEDNYTEAVEVYDRIPELSKENTNSVLTAQFYLTYGATCEQAGLKEKATEIFQEGIVKHPDSHQAMNYLAYMWADENMELESAMKLITKALELDPDNGAYIDTLGWIHYRNGEYDKALKHVERALELVPRDPTIMEHLGDIHNAVDNTKKAILWWEESYMVNPDNKAVIEKLKRHKVNLRKLRKQAKKLKKQELQAQEASGSPENIVE
ncbi:hypothetical protein BVX97_01150 [bacterium E08(2017)]|nr:hypothetical protein BVX97_01150 [bacterium E08(2017)]